jgi:hypothetical protein
MVKSDQDPDLHESSVVCLSWSGSAMMQKIGPASALTNAGMHNTEFKHIFWDRGQPNEHSLKLTAESFSDAEIFVLSSIFYFFFGYILEVVHSESV